jgi:amidase
VDADDLAYAGLARQAELIRAGEISARELTEACLARIDRLDPVLNAFRVVWPERVLAEADQADARRRGGEERPLLGVPIAIKDNVDVAGEVTPAGTGAYGPPATDDAEIVRRLRAAGASLLGKTHLPELALWPFTESATWGVTRNPWDLGRTPGGSSGGAGAAVAGGLVGVAQASDGAGSIRIPAACCGLFGLKPQRDRVPLAPDLEHWYGLSVYGALTRGVLDSALFLDATAGPAPGGPAGPPPGPSSFASAARSSPGRLRVALSVKPPGPTRLDPDVVRAVHETGALLSSLGHEVRERNPDWGLVASSLGPRYLRGACDDAAAVPRPERLERRTRGMARLGALVPQAAVERARSAGDEHARRILGLWDDHDVLLMPTLTTPAVELGRWEGRGALRTFLEVANGFGGTFTGPWNVTGQPAASVPAGLNAAGLPLAVQLVGRPNDEATLLSLAAQLEAERPWADRRPPIDRQAEHWGSAVG